jgi:hypothetical protein
LEEIIPVSERSSTGTGIYSEVIEYILVIYAVGNRFLHLLYLGCQEILATVFSVVKLPIASTAMTGFFRKIKKMKEVEAMSEGLWGYLSKLIPWKKITEDWLE